MEKLKTYKTISDVYSYFGIMGMGGCAGALLGCISAKIDNSNEKSKEM